MDDSKEPGRASTPSRDWSAPYAVAASLVFGYALVSAFRVYALGFNFPILGKHDFRQTQTALSALMMAKGGPWLIYETPLFGAPYAIPFEFPLYQWLTTLVHLLGAPLDQAGRAVSIAFFLLLLFPLYRVLRSFEFSYEVSMLTLALVVSAPLYTFWTRAFMIESTALYFAIASLAVGLDALPRLARDEGRERPRLGERKLLGLLCALATVAMLVKGTTGIVYLGLLSLLLLERFWRDDARRARWKEYALFAAVGVVVPLLLGVLWTSYCEAIRRKNPLAATLLTEELHPWIYGTWAQKTAPETWIMLWDRTWWYGFGTNVTMAGGLCLALFASKKLVPFAACLLAVLGAFALFTNLHWFHDYYQYATTVLVIIAVGFGAAAAEHWSPRARVLLPVLGALAVQQATVSYRLDYRKEQRTINMGIVEIGKYVQAHTRDSALIVLYGNDWSSVIPYYAQRRALTNRWNHPPERPDMQQALKASAARGHRVEAVLFCYADRAFNDGRATALLQHSPQCTPIKDCDVCL